MAKTASEVTIDFLGCASSEVTQSMYLVTYKDIKILLDCGLYQSSNPLTDYRINHTPIKGLKPSEIDYIFISHSHVDHCGLLPYLYANGCKAAIIVPHCNKKLIGLMLRDCAKIFEGEAERLERNFKIKNAVPLYTESDVELCEQYIQEYDFDNMHELTKGIYFEFFHSGHILGSAQILLQFQVGTLIKRIGYTGDIGCPKARQFCKKCELMPFVDVMIGESTYAVLGKGNTDPISVSQEILERVIRQSLQRTNSKVVIPVFSLDRLQTVLYELMLIQRRIGGSKFPIIVDAPLGVEISKAYNELIPEYLDSSGVSRWKKVWVNKSIIWNTDHNASKYWQDAPGNAVVLTTSGMCNNGRSVSWLQNTLPCSDNYIVFVGYAAEKTVASYVKKATSRSVIKIGGQSVPCKANITELNSFSSHMNYKELLDYYCKSNYLRLYLVHGNMDNKALFAGTVENHLRIHGKTGRAYAAQQGLRVTV